MIEIEKTRMVAVTLGEISKLLGVKSDEVLHQIPNNRNCMEVHTNDGRKIIPIEGDLLFVIIEPINNPR